MASLASNTDMDPAAAYAFMGFEDPSADAADAMKRYRELRKTPEYKENPEYKRQADAAYRAIKSKANAVSKRSSEVLEERMQAAGLSGDEQALAGLVNGHDEEHGSGALAAHPGVPPPSEIVEGFLFLGGEAQAKDAATLQRLGIRHILNMTDNLDDHTPALQAEWGAECSYCNCPAQDEKGYDIGQHLDRAVEFIDACRARGGGVLVHCRQGVNRSGSAVIAYVMHHEGMGFPSALRWVRERRPVVLTNGSFAVQLIVRSGTHGHISEAAMALLNQNCFNPFVTII